MGHRDLVKIVQTWGGHEDCPSLPRATFAEGSVPASSTFRAFKSPCSREAESDNRGKDPEVFDRIRQMQETILREIEMEDLCPGWSMEP